MFLFGCDRGIDCRGETNGSAILRMSNAAVVTLPGILDYQFPVGANVVGSRVADLCSAQIIGFETRHDVALEGAEMQGFICQIDEDKSFRQPAVRAVQAEVRQFEICTHMPGMDQ